MGNNEQDELRRVALLVGDVPSATRGVESVRPEQTLAEAQTLMSASEYSQLAVMTDAGKLMGAVSWRSIAQARLAHEKVMLSDATYDCRVVKFDDELLPQIDTVYKDDFMLVQDRSGKICGIVTAADLAYQFRDLTTQFFQIGDIEGRLRRVIGRVFTTTELRAATGQKNLSSADDMTFGQYTYLLKDVERWKKIPWGDEIDQAIFLTYLDDARRVRNKVMHSSKELLEVEKRQLERFFNLMRALDRRSLVCRAAFAGPGRALYW